MIGYLYENNWPLLAVITWFLAFGTGVWADMPDLFI
jgi:hypothetical protein